jgi:tRNA(Ile)-lysidine synthase TilS/MesJ
MLKRIADFLREYELQDKTVVVGFSGGYDSMCLLDALYKIKQIDGFYDLRIIAAHFNHNWRGEESLREQEVCRLFATSKSHNAIHGSDSDENAERESAFFFSRQEWLRRDLVGFHE